MLVSVRRFWFQQSMVSSQQIRDIEFCFMAFISTSNLADAVQVSPGSTRGISIYEMMPNAPDAESETLLKSGRAVFNDESQGAHSV